MIIKFTDTTTPTLLWAKKSLRQGYVFTLTVVESLNKVYAGGHGKDATNNGVARLVFCLDSNTGTAGFAYYEFIGETTFHEV
jgi:hypothetical protein